jgi:hypothetical protein
MINKSTNCLVICHNRPHLLHRCLAALESSPNIKSLYLFCDGPRNNSEAARKTQQDIGGLFNKAKHQRGCEETKLFFSDSNLGPIKGPLLAIQWFLNEKKEGCILEEDIIASKEFITFYAYCLEIFRENKEISLISSAPQHAEKLEQNSHPLGAPLRESQLFLTWGWATWLDRWENFGLESPNQIEQSIRRASEALQSKKEIQTVSNKFMSLVARLYFKRELAILAKSPNHAWSYYIQREIKNKDLLTLMPTTNMTTNIGSGPGATRTKVLKYNWAIPEETKNVLGLLESKRNLKTNEINKKDIVEPFNKDTERALENLKYGPLIDEIRAWMKIRTRIKSLLKV